MVMSSRSIRRRPTAIKANKQSGKGVIGNIIFEMTATSCRQTDIDMDELLPNL